MIRVRPEHGWRKVGGALARKHARERQRRKRKRRRPKIAAKRRERIYARDGYKCVECGCKDRDKLTIDHRIPLSKGGENTDENLQTMCGKCNHSKGDTVPWSARRV